MESTQIKMGDLDCTVIDMPGASDQLRAAVVICHGFGAPGTDLVPVAAELSRFDSNGLQGVRLVFPMAPIELEPDGVYDSRAWWPIDMLQLQQIIETGQLRDLRRERPELMEVRFEQLTALLDQLRRETGLENRQIVVGGFSQGAMLMTDVALRTEPVVGGLIVWSGTLLSEDTWKMLAPKRRGLPVIQTHGRMDPILPFQGAEFLHQLFTDSGIDVEFSAFHGPHTISTEGIEMAARLIAQVASTDKRQ